MGIFDSVYIKCPHCDEMNEEQFKPGCMNSYIFPDDVHKMPIDLVKSFEDAELTCFECEGVFKTEVAVTISVHNAKVVKP